jgi:hypothetical protein
VEGIDRLQLLEWPTVLAAYRGEDVASMLAEQAGIADASPGFEDVLLERRAAIAFAAGRLTESRELWRRYASVSPLNAPVALAKAGRAALWAGDGAGIRADLEALVGTGARGRWPKASRLTLEAGLAALAGQQAEARTRYRDAQRAWREIGFAWDEALTCLDLVIALGPADPDAPASAEQARQVFRDLGARPFLERLEAGLPVDATSAVEKGDPAFTGASGRPGQRR